LDHLLVSYFTFASIVALICVLFVVGQHLWRHTEPLALRIALHTSADELQKVLAVANKNRWGQTSERARAMDWLRQGNDAENTRK